MCQSQEAGEDLIGAPQGRHNWAALLVYEGANWGPGQTGLQHPPVYARVGAGDWLGGRF